MTAAAMLLRLAADTLDDARLLAERRRQNEAVLTRLALQQALRAVSVEQGLEAGDDLRLDTLFKRVPADHPQAGLIRALERDGAQTIAAVAGLVEALRRPRETPPPPRRAGKTVPRPEPGPPGSTALAASPRGDARAGPAPSYPSAAFWTLMDRWQVPDRDGLRLIGHSGGLTANGTRPRFRLRDAEAARYATLRALDEALAALGLDPGRWLAVPLDPPLPGGATPLAALLHDPDACHDLLRRLHRQGLRATLQGG